MTYKAQIEFLIHTLLKEMPEYKTAAAEFSDDTVSQRKLLRALMNVSPPMKLDPDFLTVQDALLQSEVRHKGIITVDSLMTLAQIRPSRHKTDGQLILWQGDITRIAADAIVNAANSALLGCFHPGHKCIDNEIHSAAGLQLREACAVVMQAQGHHEPEGQAKITPAFNLPSRFVLHTVGPIVSDDLGTVTDTEKKLLADCYRSCLDLALEYNLQLVAFCCISTGIFHFPRELAAKIAIRSVLDWLLKHNSTIKIIFNTFKDEDTGIYQKLLYLK